MNPLRSSLLNRLTRRNLETHRLLTESLYWIAPPASVASAAAEEKRRYSSGRTTFRSSELLQKIYPLGDPNDASLVSVIDSWVNIGNRVRPWEIQHVIRDLRKRRSFKQALEVSEWMSNKKIGALCPSHHALQLDLIGRIHGLASAEAYFNKLQGKDKNNKSYGALLNCYVRDCLVDKSITHLQKMKELGFASTALTYNNIMCLYTNTNQHEKVPLIFSEMKKNKVSPDNFSYRICMNSYGVRSDIEMAERILDEMEKQPHIAVDWNTYSTMAGIYIKAGLSDRAISTLKKMEERVEWNNGLAYGHLISHFANLGDKSEIQRIWELQKSNCKRITNNDYKVMLAGLVKLREIEGAELLFNEWESSGNHFDCRVPNILLNEYRKMGLLEKAEAMLNKMEENGKTPLSSCWGILACGYAQEEEMRKAFECMRKALALYVSNAGWQPNSEVVSRIVGWLGEQGKAEELDMFLGLLSKAVNLDREMYHAMIKANIRDGKDVDWVLRGMKAAKIEIDGETEEILRVKECDQTGSVGESEADDSLQILN
ncbi:Pentatricopeptide repeat-containing protein [Acorus gramineus]|uniref:Pentatricopeptide repeat-containing protein n=1 Tax=Acorus gramineus TaxID=55184 RepID=A0AAV9AA45_ACOGR|nr:Pentatricopeptide repeat-containing protein [Acorus gramineus]